MPDVRLARPDDAPAILALHVAAIRARAPDAYDERQVAAWARKDGGPERYPVEEDGHFLVVAERDGEVAAYGELVPGQAEVRAVYVHPAAHGRGVGSAVLARLEGEARRRGLDELVCWSSLNATGFYDRAGYRRVAERTIRKELDGRPVAFPVVEMRKSLDR
ncbi:MULTISPECIES: GNAT family N-acetyltransferase [Halorussus]|uniref:GNAT family N-acetyltransferase n=1 Tax=Halorussus TaxID=1070314 RepID=UPI0020A0B061|nr:GNAT family N-acetyltransferase [Halorussus vallis]USZ73960.1 GNAT family N-acetyltransferase [Halorussus vallis]